MTVRITIKPGSQYDTGAAGAVSITGKNFFRQSNSIPDIKFFDNLIGQTMGNSSDAMLEKKLSLILCHPDAHNATLDKGGDGQDDNEV